MRSLKKIQITLIQIDNYGPWTVTPRSKPEAYLQSLQSRLFADIEDEFASHGGLVFSTRFDNMLAATNGISLDEHREIQDKFHDKYPVTVSMGVGVGETPWEAQEGASKALQELGSSQSAERQGVLAGEVLDSSDEGWVQIAHMDVNHATPMTDNEPVYDTYKLIQEVHSTLARELPKLGALAFYTGGDNFMAFANKLSEKDLEKVFEIVKKETGVKLKAGIGRAPTAVEAAGLADEGLHEVREGKSKGQIMVRQSQKC